VSEWVTKTVRAYNVLAGDVVDVFDAKKHRAVKLTVQWVDDSEERGEPGKVDIGFRRKTFGWRLERLKLVRVRRLVRR
jgi:hypothetical protein